MPLINNATRDFFKALSAGYRAFRGNWDSSQANRAEFEEHYERGLQLDREVAEDAARRDYLKQLALKGDAPEIDDLTEDEGLWLAELDAQQSYEDELQTRRDAELSSRDPDNDHEPER